MAGPRAPLTPDQGAINSDISCLGRRNCAKWRIMEIETNN
ncbi:4507_t:CDS:2 [Ambispora gerdemannii]|uniref:4507_t:CDS:1 n=1 Tax=Ambispora gerdemannii TaxID=144530 RepID=A0A9N9GMV7_9GLOM|nr:4507_t:CDS:2 [Ambispora gerdemannii]